MLKIAVSRGFGEGCKQVDYSVTVQDTNKRFRTRLVHQKRGPQLRGFVVKKISGEMPHFDISVVFFFKKSENHHMRPSRTMRRKTPVKVSFFYPMVQLLIYSSYDYDFFTSVIPLSRSNFLIYITSS